MRVWKGLGRRARCLHIHAYVRCPGAFSLFLISRDCATCLPEVKPVVEFPPPPIKQHAEVHYTNVLLVLVDPAGRLASLLNLPPSLLSMESSKPLHGGGQVFCLHIVRRQCPQTNPEGGNDSKEHMFAYSDRPAAASQGVLIAAL